MNTHELIPRIISAMMSIIQAAKLRNRVYAMEDRLDILEVAIEDISRINSNSDQPNPLITNIVTNVKKHEQSIKQYID